MAISRVQCVAAQANTVSFTAPSLGDVIVVFAHRDGSTTAPTIPSGFTGYQQIDDGASGANTNSAIIGYRLSDGTETSTGTWTNATSICAGIYRGCDPNTPLGGWGKNGGTVANNANMTYPAMTMFRGSDNTSWGVLFGAGRTTTNVGTNAPSGTVAQASATDCAIFDTNGTITSRSSSTAAVTASSTSGYRTFTVELMCRRISTFSPDPLIQAASSLAQGENGNAFKIAFPNTTLANNLLLVAFSYDHGVSISSVTDSNSTSWTAGPTAVGDGSSYVKDCALYYLLGSPAASTVTITFSGNVQYFDYVFCEFKGVKTSSAVDGTATGSAAQVTPFIQAGSITTTQAGDLVFNYAHDVWKTDWLASIKTTGISPDTNFALIAASRANHYAAQYSVQAASGAINPKITMKAYDLASGGDITDIPCSALSIAFKQDGSGTSRPGDIRVVRVHTEANWPSGFGSGTIQFPTVGNLIAGFTSSWPAIGCDWTGTRDTQANTWTYIPVDTSSPQSWIAENATPSTDKAISTTWTGTNRAWMKWYDIIAATVEPAETAVFATGTQSSAGADITHAPDITPNNSNGLVIIMGGVPTGPASGCYSPTGAIFGSTTYTGETDFGWMNNGDLSAIYYNPDTTALNVSWHMNNPSLTQWNVLGVCFAGQININAIPIKSVHDWAAIRRAAFY